MNFKQLCEIAELTDEEAFKANLDSMKEAVYRSFMNKGKKVGYINSKGDKAIEYAYTAKSGETYTSRVVKFMLSRVETLQDMDEIMSRLDITI
jgi:hypothetical protein